MTKYLYFDCNMEDTLDKEHYTGFRRLHSKIAVWQLRTSMV